jgi:general secretion pathway protein E
VRRKRERPTDSGVVPLIDGLIARALDARASDIHFEPTDAGVQVRLRVDGVLHETETIPLLLLPNVVTRLKVMGSLLSYRVDIPQEGGLTLEGRPDVDARISTFPTIRGERVVVRLLPGESGVRDLHALGLSEMFVGKLIAAAAEMQGLILVTGPAGSGKTTTLYALLRHLRATRPGVSLMTVEDPVELRLDGVAQIQVTPHGELTYARALRSLLRQDPQVVLIGEIRDEETARIALEAALTGHLILSTMHSGYAVDALLRLLEMNLPGYQITSTVRLVVCQRLVRTLCGACRGRAAVAPAEQHCRSCLGCGFQGRTAIAECAEMTPELRQAILRSADARELGETVARQSGFTGLAADAQRHLRASRTTESEVSRMVLPRSSSDTRA